MSCGEDNKTRIVKQLKKNARIAKKNIQVTTKVAKYIKNFLKKSKKEKKTISHEK